MSVKRARYATKAERIIAHIDGVSRAFLVAAAVIAAALGGAWFGANAQPDPMPPQVVEVLVQPSKYQNKQQADAEIAAFNRGMDAGKFIGCELPPIDDIEPVTP